MLAPQSIARSTAATQSVQHTTKPTAVAKAQAVLEAGPSTARAAGIPEPQEAPQDHFASSARWRTPSCAAPSELLAAPNARITTENRYRPEQPCVTPKTISQAQVVPPVVEFGATCPAPLRETICVLFRQVSDAAAAYGLGDATAKTFHIHYISRSKWLDRLYDYDRDREHNPPTLWARMSRWLTRLINAWTIPIEKDAVHDIFIIAENFRAQTSVHQNKSLVEVMVQCLQKASHPRFMARQADYLKHMRTDFQNDTRPYFASKAMAELNLALCLEKLTRTSAVPLVTSHWIPDVWAFWRRKPRPEMQILLNRLRDEPEVDRWFRLMFEDESYAQLLLQKGGVVELSKNLTPEEELLVNQLRQINPYDAPRVRRV